MNKTEKTIDPTTAHVSEPIILFYKKTLKKTGKPIVVQQGIGKNLKEFQVASVKHPNCRIEMSFNNSVGNPKKAGASTVLYVWPNPIFEKLKAKELTTEIINRHQQLVKQTIKKSDTQKKLLLKLDKDFTKLLALIDGKPNSDTIEELCKK